MNTQSRPDHSLLLSTARRAVSLAAIVCDRVQRDLDRVRAITKDDKSPVTVADFASQAVVAHVLARELGIGVRLVGEEDADALRGADRAAHLDTVVEAVRHVWSGAGRDDVLRAIDLGSAQTSSEGFWTLDPIDGTKGFLRGQQYAISLAFIEGGVPVVGALACPNLSIDQSRSIEEGDGRGSIYTATLGGGCEESVGGADGSAARRIRRDDRAGPVRVCASVEKAHSSVSDTDRVLERMGEAGEPVRLDSQAKYAVVARGQADAYLRLPTKKDYVERIWDHAAGSLIATEAGCVVSDIHGKPLDFSQGRGLERNAGVICATPSIHARIIGAIRDLGIGR